VSKEFFQFLEITAEFTLTYEELRTDPHNLHNPFTIPTSVTNKVIAAKGSDLSWSPQLPVSHSYPTEELTYWKFFRRGTEEMTSIDSQSPFRVLSSQLLSNH
jgi:hypothetical protein